MGFGRLSKKLLAPLLLAQGLADWAVPISLGAAYCARRAMVLPATELRGPRGSKASNKE